MPHRCSDGRVFHANLGAEQQQYNTQAGIGLSLICLTREEGPLFAFSIHLFVVFWKTQQQQTSARLGTFLRLATRLGLLYGVLFGLEMTSIGYIAETGLNVLARPLGRCICRTNEVRWKRTYI